MVHPEGPAVVLCTTCRNRRAHAALTIPRNLRDNPGAKVVLLDYGDQEGLGDYVRRHHQADLATGRLIYYRTEQPFFRMAHAKNMAHRLGIREGGRILANIDADNFTGRGFARFVQQRFVQAAREGEAIFLRTREGFGPLMGRSVGWDTYGRIVVLANAFLQAGGYDERYQGWSPDDKDFTRRLQRLGYTRYGLPPTCLKSIQHDDGLRFANYGPDQARSTDEAHKAFGLKGRDDLTVVNGGEVGCGTVWRNFDPRPIELKPIPTRIFGIGMHKTATTSLSRALEILGFDSAHYISARWARTIVDEMREKGVSRTLEGYYCVSDMPIGLYFRELDRLYPGSKFILTVRDDETWLRSVEAHWARYYVSDWNRDGGSHFIHRAIYGQQDFDPWVFLDRKREHEAAVREWFAWHPEDLLEIDVSAGMTWGPLCEFLDVPEPGVPYPREFVTPRVERIYPSGA